MTLRTLASWSALLVVAHALEPVPRGDALIGSQGVVSLSCNGSSPDTFILDYGQNVEGVPTFEVLSTSGDTSGLEITYAESRPSFAHYMVALPSPSL